MKQKHNLGGIVYSTDPNYILNEEQGQPEVYPEAANQPIKIRLETKHRAGKAVTLVDGFKGSTAEQEELGKKLKGHCGTGGSVKDGEIIIQGDQREKVYQWLQKNGYFKARKV